MEVNKTPKVSVIIPIYKAEKFIERCCVSLFEQTLDDMEYIFVDDCTPDNSIALIREIVRRYPYRETQVRILTHTPNRGVSFSRQQGLDATTGEFVIHCDSDDWLELNTYELAYNKAIETGADIVRFGHYVNCSDGSEGICGYPIPNYFDDYTFNISPMIGAVWNCLIRRDLLVKNDIRFPQNINWGEDFCVVIPALVLSNKTVCLTEFLYHYWQNSESITHTLTDKRCIELVSVAKYIEDFLDRYNKTNEFLSHLNYLKFQTKSYYVTHKEVRDLKKWMDTYPECNTDIDNFPIPQYLKIVSKQLVKRHIGFAKLILWCLDIYRRVRL